VKDVYGHPITRPLMRVSEGVAGAGLVQIGMFWIQPVLVLTGLCYLIFSFSLLLFTWHLWKALNGLK